MRRHPLARAAVAACVLALAGTACDAGQGPPERVTPVSTSSDSGRWAVRAPIPTPRSEVGVAAVGGRVYVVGGFGGTTVNEEYDPATDRWRARAPLPRGVHHPGVAGIAGKLYVVGGYADPGGQPTAGLWEYDPAGDSWRERAPLPTPRSGIAAAAVGGRIFVFGGEQPSGTFEQNEGYDPRADAWASFAPMPTARHGIGAAVLGGTVYLPAGGPTPGGSQTERHETFTP